MDKYASFHELLRSETEGTDFQVRTGKRAGAATAVIAPHGGSIEPATSELAVAIAGDDLDFGCFEGLKASGNRDLHITSANFDEPEIVELVSVAEYVLALHGEAGPDAVVYLGGADDRLGQAIADALSTAGFTVRSHNDPNLQGKVPGNICNRGRRRKGVQLELGRGLRESFFQSLTAEGRRSPTGKFNDFVSVVRAGLRRGGAL